MDCDEGARLVDEESRFLSILRRWTSSLTRFLTTFLKSSCTSYAVASLPNFFRRGCDLEESCCSTGLKFRASFYVYYKYIYVTPPPDVPIFVWCVYGTGMCPQSFMCVLALSR